MPKSVWKWRHGIMLLQNTKTTGPTLLYAFVGERKVAMDGVDTENSLSVLKDRIKQKSQRKISA